LQKDDIYYKYCYLYDFEVLGYPVSRPTKKRFLTLTTSLGRHYTENVAMRALRDHHDSSVTSKIDQAEKWAFPFHLCSKAIDAHNLPSRDKVVDQGKDHTFFFL
jgi:hypothetical protein